MSAIYIGLFIFSIVIIAIYLCPGVGDIDDDEGEFTFIDSIFLLTAIVYFLWFICSYAKSYIG